MNKKYIKIAVVVVLVSALAYACTATKSQKNMSTRQNMLKSFYPVLTSVTRFFGVNSKVVLPKTIAEPLTSVYTIPFELINGDTADLSVYRGKKIVIVNTASDCGYTGQYEELQKLYEQRKDDIVIIGFPANDFKEQEKGSNEEIASFCKKNYGVEFPMAMKTSVVKSSTQHDLFKWLSEAGKNGWNEQAPSWNFSKYIIDEQGKLIGYFDPGVSPLGKEFTNIINTPKP
jgi:glutathione peroxidase